MNAHSTVGCQSYRGGGPECIRNRRKRPFVLSRWSGIGIAFGRFVLLGSVLSGGKMEGQTRQEMPLLTPPAWLQLRNSTDNAGTVKATLNTSWHFKSRLPVRAVSVAAGMVLLGAESADAETNSPSGDEQGSLTSLDASTGKLLWSRVVPSWIHSDALIYRGRVYATCGRWPMTHIGGLLALDARTGNTLWTVAADAGMMPGAAIDTARGSITVVGGDGLLSTLRLMDGSTLRSVGLMAAVGMSSVRLDSEGTAIVGAARVLTSYSTRTGRLNWTFEPRFGLRALGDVPIALTDDLVFTTGSRSFGFMNAVRVLPFEQFLSLSRRALRTEKLRAIRSWFHEQWLIAVDRRTGQMMWRRPLGIGLSVPRNQSGTPVVVAGRVLVSSPISQTVWAFTAANGSVAWSHRLDAMHKGAVTIAGHDVVVGDKDGKMTLLRLVDGALVGKCDGGSPFSVTAPLMVGKTMIVAMRDGNVWATPYDTLRSRAVHGLKCFRPDVP